MKFTGVVILYYPENKWIKNIMTYIGFLEKLIIIDNSPKPIDSLPENILQKTVYLHENGNMGIAKRLNQALDYANKEGFKFLLTMDQDSSFEENHIKSYIQKATEYLSSNSIIAVGIPFDPPSNSLKMSQDLLITAGTIINIEHALRLNGFDEKLFIDYVDTEFCLRAWKNSYQTIAINGVKMNHEFGEGKLVWSPKIKKEVRRFHTPIRLYYLTRNYLYTKNKYPEFKIYLPFSYIVYEIKNAILYGGKPFSYFYQIIRGIKDYLNNQMGK